MKRPIIIAGPCAVESEEQIIRIAIELKKIGEEALISFTIKDCKSNTNTYYAKNNMTWEEWVNSEYCPVSENIEFGSDGILTYKVYNNGVLNASCNLLNTKNQFVKNNSVIKTNDIYTSGGSGVILG